MKAIVDCNSFYCSCERLFNPGLDQKPVVVLSNNDGCIISRSDEAKAFGVQMAGPYFLAKPLIEKHHVATFSSNYNLYGDLSWRVMETLRIMLGEDKVEVYSVDEAFLDLGEYDSSEALFGAALEIRKTVELWTGIKVSVGIAPTKVLSKVANHLAKKNKIATECVVVLDTKEKIDAALQNTPVNEVWGVGFQYAKKLKELFAVFTAFDLTKKTAEWAHANMGGVVGERLLKELKGESVSKMEDQLTVKKMIATTRMFGNPVTSIADIKEAIATYTSKAAEKLRRQQSAANVISIFVVPKVTPKEGERFSYGPMLRTYTTLPVATSATNELIAPAVKLVDHLYKKGELYKKAGVMLSGLVPDETIQGNLFLEKQNNTRLLMNMIDNINFSQRNDIIKFAASGTTRDWKMRMELRSPRYTSRWDEIFQVK